MRTQACEDGSLLEKLDQDTITHLLTFLDAPIDLYSASLVSRSWNKYVLEGSLWKNMCTKCFPELGDFELIIEPPRGQESLQCKTSSLQLLRKVTGIYQQLLRELQGCPAARSCICEPLHASSTDNVPLESIVQTLVSSSVDAVGNLPSYWSSGGQSKTEIPELLTYRLVSDLCVIHEVKIQPFQAYFQPGHPIYSAKSVLFRFGYSRSPWPHWTGLVENLSQQPPRINYDDYVWTYESPAFSMSQEDTLQTFKLPKPVVCIGGIFQIEFMGRVQTQYTDRLYYICISHVDVSGRPLFDFELEHPHSNHHYVLTYKPKENSGFRGRASAPFMHYPAEAFPRWPILRDRFVHLRSKMVGLTERLHFDMLLRNLTTEGVLTNYDDVLLEDG